MDMINKLEVQHLDEEWVELIQTAKILGLSREEIHIFFKENTPIE